MSELKLTEKQEKAVDAYGLEMLKNGIKAGVKIDQKKAASAIDILYRKDLDLSPPKVVFVASPEAALLAASKITGSTPKDLVSEIQWLNLWTWWVAYYHAGIYILGETKDVEADLIEELSEYEAMVRELHAILPCEKTCFVIEYPKTVAIKDDDLEKFVLHREGGLALEYSDGTGFAWLNNVEVPKWIATTSPNKISIKKLMAESNVDIRREGLRRVPLARFLKATKAKLIERIKDAKIKWWDYELYDADFGDGKKRRLLRMFDVASKGYPVERVEENSSVSVEKALAWRDNEDTYIRPSVRT